MSAKDMTIRKSVTIDNTLEEDIEDMPIEYLNHDEKQLTKKQRLLVWNAVNDPQLTFAEAAKKAGYKNPVVVGRLMRKREDSPYAHVRREYERLMSEAKKKFELTHERAIQAQGLLLKVGGLIIDRREVLHGKIDQMSREEVERRLQDLLGSKSGITIENKSGKNLLESKKSG